MSQLGFRSTTPVWRLWILAMVSTLGSVLTWKGIWNLLEYTLPPGPSTEAWSIVFGLVLLTLTKSLINKASIVDANTLFVTV
jgi:hypothetical protein